MAIGRHGVLWVAALLAGLAGSALPGDPWIGLGLGAFLAIVGAAIATARPSWRNLCVSAATIVLGLWVFETSIVVREALRPAERFEGSYTSQSYFDPDDPVLGYSARRGVRVESIKRVGDRVVYDVDYTIDASGLRRTAAAPPAAPSEGCVLFFGCSITFGEGLEDGQTLPWRVAERSGGRWRAFNFGFHGYGPHQMLAQLESGRVRQAVGECAGRQVAVLQYFADHVLRALGRTDWDTDGPWYVPDGTGGVRLAGRLDQRPEAGRERAMSRWQPRLAAWLDGRLWPTTTAREREFFVALVAAARARFLLDYPNGEWHLVLLDAHPDPALVAALERNGVQVHPIAAILTDPEALEYRMTGDDHPNALYNYRLAAWIVEHVLEH